ncbi:hypothetical protein SteCoe_5496 [Stentor coeruleus]|uniref:Uncharacterized protein n=1 Tax=Stentor coeruleus TaxID=5963 RepID=A0A1R2CS67_9CILI|nr:hypothetical protein SteCoe_5496 [Stentor coeruleus]
MDSRQMQKFDANLKKALHSLSTKETYVINMTSRNIDQIRAKTYECTKNSLDLKNLIIEAKNAALNKVKMNFKIIKMIEDLNTDKKTIKSAINTLRNDIQTAASEYFLGKRLSDLQQSHSDLEKKLLNLDSIYSELQISEKKLRNRELKAKDDLENYTQIIKFHDIKQNELSPENQNISWILYIPRNNSFLQKLIIWPNFVLEEPINSNNENDIYTDGGFSLTNDGKVYFLSGKIKEVGNVIQETDKFSYVIFPGERFTLKKFALPYGFSYCGTCASYGQFIYIFGGIRANSNIGVSLRLDTISLQLIGLTVLPTKIFNANSVLFNTEICIGGIGSDILYFYNLKKNSYDKIGKSYDQNCMKLFLCDGKDLYMIFNKFILKLKKNKQNSNGVTFCRKGVNVNIDQKLRFLTYPIYYGKYFYFVLTNRIVYRLDIFSLKIKEIHTLN